MEKYTKEILQAVVVRSTSVSGVLRLLGFQSYSGSMSAHIQKRIAKHGIDTSHFKGLHHNLGVVSKRRKKAGEILGHASSTRVKTLQLRRALIELGVAYSCVLCEQGPEWRGGTLVLVVDHKDGDWANNTKENLRFLCPNCHSQTPTFGSRNRRK
jgi:hypothetical protein